MQKWAGMLLETGKAFVDPSAMMTQIWDDSDFWSLPPLTTLCFAATFGHHKASRKWTWHSPNGQHHNQIDYILERKHLTELIKICYVFAVVFKQEYQVFYNREKMSLIWIWYMSVLLFSLSYMSNLWNAINSLCWLKEPGQQNLTAEFMVVTEAWKTTMGLTPCPKEWTFDSSGLPPEGIISPVSAIPHRRDRMTKL